MESEFAWYGSTGPKSKLFVPQPFACEQSLRQQVLTRHFWQEPCFRFGFINQWKRHIQSLPDMVPLDQNRNCLFRSSFCVIKVLDNKFWRGIFDRNLVFRLGVLNPDPENDKTWFPLAKSCNPWNISFYWCRMLMLLIGMCEIVCETLCVACVDSYAGKGKASGWLP